MRFVTISGQSGLIIWQSVVIITVCFLSTNVARAHKVSEVGASDVRSSREATRTAQHGHEGDSDASIYSQSNGAASKYSARPGRERRVPRVNLWSLPDGGIQPQALCDRNGTVHLLYFKGDPAHGDLYYTTRRQGDSQFAPPLCVNSLLGSACAIGSIRGGQMAVDGQGNVYVVWNGSAPIPSQKRLPMYFTHLIKKTAFDKQRNLIAGRECIDGGGSVAADGRGNVYVTWHATPPNQSEAAGRVYLAFSCNGGRSFSTERTIDGADGACGCCGMKAALDRMGRLYVLYRAAQENIERDAVLLVSLDGGRTFSKQVLDRWHLNGCPMTLFALSESQGGVVSAWETLGQICFSTIQFGHENCKSHRAGPAKRIVVSNKTVCGQDAKYPALAINCHEERLIAWTQGAGWNRSGNLYWRLYTEKERLKMQSKTGQALKAWSFPATVALPNGDFSIIY